MIDGLSDTLQRQIERFTIASNIHNDLTDMWANVQTQELNNPQIDSHSMRQLTECHLLRRLADSHSLRADLSNNILKQATSDGVLTLAVNKKLTNRELVECVTTFINYMTDPFVNDVKGITNDSSHKKHCYLIIN